MNKLALGIVAIIIIIAVVLSTIFVVGTDIGPILPDDGDNGEDQDSSIADIRIDYPASCSIPKKGPWYSIDVEGSIYGTNIDVVSKVIVAWHTGIDYGKQEISSSNFDQYDQYNAIWNTDMLIERLGSGEHTLTARAADSSGTVLSQDYVIITIPEYYIYEWDSDNPKYSGGYEDGSYYYKIGMSFKSSYPNVEWAWLRGEIIKVKGKVHVSTYTGGTSELWANFWNPSTESWNTVKKGIVTNGEGWVDIDINTNNQFASWISFAGVSVDGQGAPPCDTVDGFKGEVWVKPGTINYQQSPLEIVMSIFGGDSFDNPPTPIRN